MNKGEFKLFLEQLDSIIEKAREKAREKFLKLKDKDNNCYMSNIWIMPLNDGVIFEFELVGETIDNIEKILIFVKINISGELELDFVNYDKEAPLKFVRTLYN